MLLSKKLDEGNDNNDDDNYNNDDDNDNNDDDNDNYDDKDNGDGTSPTVWCRQA